MTCDPFTSLPEPVADCSPTSYLDTSPSEPSNSIPIAVPSCEPDETTAGSPDCECMSKTSACSIHPSTPAAWISSQVVSLARMCHLLEKAQASPENGRDSGANSQECLGWYDPDSHSLKTARSSPGGDSTSSLAILPRWGTMRSGRLYPQPRLAPPTKGRESGYWPTPSYTDYKIASKNGQRRRQLGDPAMGIIPRGGKLNPQFVVWLMGWPMNWFQAGGKASPASEEWPQECQTGLAKSKRSATDRFHSRRHSPGQS